MLRLDLLLDREQARESAAGASVNRHELVDIVEMKERHTDRRRITSYNVCYTKLLRLIALYCLAAYYLHRVVLVLTSALTIRRLAGGNVDLDHKNTLGAQCCKKCAKVRNTQTTSRTC